MVFINNNLVIELCNIYKSDIILNTNERDSPAVDTILSRLGVVFMSHPIYGIRSLSAIPVYIIMAVLALCFGLLLKYSYKHNTKLADIMNKAFSRCILISYVGWEM